METRTRSKLLVDLALKQGTVDELSDISDASANTIDDSFEDPDFSPYSDISSPRPDYCCLLSDDEDYMIRDIEQNTSKEIPLASAVSFSSFKEHDTSDTSEPIPVASPTQFNEFKGDNYDDINKETAINSNDKIKIISDIVVNLNEKHLRNDQLKEVEFHNQLEENTDKSSNKENIILYQEPPASNKLQKTATENFDTRELCMADSGRLPFTVTEYLNSQVTQTDRNKRIWNKRDFCLYCYENVTNFSRHLIRKHSSEVAVKQFMDMKVGSIERKTFIDLLRKKGNFISPAQKEIKMVKRPTKNVVPANVVPCMYCKGYYMKRYLKRHISNCKNRPNSTATSSENCYSQDAQTYLAFRCMDNDFVNRLQVKKGILNMRCDAISLIVKSEPLILSFGSFYAKRHRHKHLNKVTKNKLRELARLWQDISRYIKEKSFFEALKPENFKYFVLCTQNITGFNAETQKFEKSPSLALHLGTTLKKLCEHAFSEIQQKNMTFIQGVDTAKKAKEIKTLKSLIEINWNAEVSSVANQNLKENQWMKPTIIPLTSDIQKLNNFVKEIARNCHDKLRENSDDRKAFNELQKCCYTLLITLNRRRVGELERLELQSYLQENNNIISEEFQQNLTEAEKLLLKKYKRICIRGKRHKPVPVLISKEVQEYISTLLSVREKFAPATNPYLFVTVNKETCIDGYSALKNFAKAAGAEYPQALTSGKLRKHIATISQIHNLDSCELEQLCSFLGHTMTTHQHFYRLPQELYQTAKLAKHLLKSQNESTDIDNMDEVLSSDDDVDETIENDVGDTIENKNNDDGINYPVLTTAQVEKKSEPQKVLNKGQESNKENFQKDSTEQTSRNLKKTEKVKHVKVKWTTEQKNITKHYFKNNINTKKPPIEAEIQIFKEQYPVMENKTWQQIKVFVYNIYKAK